MVAPANFTWGNYIQLLKGAAFGYVLVFRGIPKKFPKDIGLRKLAKAIRIAFTMVVILFITLVIVGYFFYKSTS